MLKQESAGKDISEDIINDVEEVTQPGSDLLADLMEFIENQEDAELKEIEDAAKGFSIDSMEQANYFVKKVVKIQKKIESINNTAKAEIEKHNARVNEWATKESAGLQNEIDRLNIFLQEFAKKELEGSKKKSVKLPNGTIAFKSIPDQYKYDKKFDSVVEDLAKENEALKKYIHYTVKADKASMKKDAKIKDGKMFINNVEITGVEIKTDLPDKFSVK